MTSNSDLVWSYLLDAERPAAHKADVYRQVASWVACLALAELCSFLRGAPARLADDLAGRWAVAHDMTCLCGDDFRRARRALSSSTLVVLESARQAQLAALLPAPTVPAVPAVPARGWLRECLGL